MARRPCGVPCTPHVRMEGRRPLHGSTYSLSPWDGTEPGLGPARPLLGRAGLSQKELAPGTQCLAGRKRGADTVKWGDGWMGGWMDG